MILIAKCRLGHPCRYHGRSVPSPAVIRLSQQREHQAICPEMIAGYSVPRPPIRIKNGQYLMDGEDITKKIKTACAKIAAEHADKKYYIGVSGSPCCDPRTGLFARALKQKGVVTVLSGR